MRYKTASGMGIFFKTWILVVFALIGSSSSRAQITEQEFLTAGERLRAIYEPKATATSETLYMRLLWRDTDMAYAQHLENYKQYEVTVTGDHARLPGMSVDAFNLLLCHEFGHLFGGAPYAKPYLASYEGQSDYYSTQKCFKRLVMNDDNAAIVRTLGPRVTSEMHGICAQVYSPGSSQMNICLRGMVASIELIRAKNPTEALSLTLKDPYETWFTLFDHPTAQCRLDTLVAGLLCDATGKVSNTDYRKGTCTAARGHKIGLRPKCWFNPSDKI